ncbi:MAG: flavodoxin-dependent (E)-4-hydroxy-3-methylbut-2-enyl-diphosphate synthase, partial [Thermoguttaceae bacterium]|nr:flavodoxin-dependent (E)-4-hydroxy-3-methylbut-2-enyl-diphosphate synthase [Thermoguttaceae bacterium]
MSGKRTIRIGTVVIGRGNPIALQSMAASKTTDIDATVETVNRLERAGAAIVRLAVDTERDAEALPEIRRQTHVSLSIDLQENYRLAEKAAPYVVKLRYNPGHLHHAEPDRPWREKVRW